jgi:hypothetical protein
MVARPRAVRNALARRPRAPPPNATNVDLC